MWNDLSIRLRAIFRRRVMEAELDEGVRTHLEKEVEKYVKAGETRAA